MSDLSPSVTLSIPLPYSLDDRIYVHITHRAKAITIFITTASPEESSGSSPTPLGSFVYALPDVINHLPPPPLHLSSLSQWETKEHY